MNEFLNEDEALSFIMKQLSSHKSLQLGFSFRCWRMRDFVLVCKCSLILVGKWWFVPTMFAAQANFSTTKDVRATGKQPFKVNSSCNLNGEKTILTLVFLQNVLHNPIFFFFWYCLNKNQSMVVYGKKRFCCYDQYWCFP